MKRSKATKRVLLGAFILAGLLALFGSRTGFTALFFPLIFNKYGYVVLAWNDLGMHCYNRDFSDLGVLPPYNNLWAQVIKVGDPPQKITQGITVTYEFPDNTYSVGIVTKSNFWTYAQKLFGLDAPLPANVGLTGKGLKGTMDQIGDHFQADGIPLTEFRDSDPFRPYPYQLATVIVRDTASGAELARTTTVSPVSTEMHCDTCHKDGGVEGVATGKVETNILTYHDRENGTNLMGSRPVLCAKCHGSNALGMTGNPNLPNFSKAMHSKHSGKVPNTTDGCYQCHPGPITKCLRDVMSQKYNLTCIECHGNMSKVAENLNPWLNEPRCDNCHTNPNFAQNNALYRHSTGHGGVYCEACHDSTHAIALSREANDAIKFIGWQGFNGTLRKCTVCHATQPTQPGPHKLALGKK
jgi:hypothetical protein